MATKPLPEREHCDLCPELATFQLGWGVTNLQQFYCDEHLLRVIRELVATSRHGVGWKNLRQVVPTTSLYVWWHPNDTRG